MTAPTRGTSTSSAGSAREVPVYSGILIVFTLASLGLPGLSGFISEFMSLMGGFAAFKLITIISVLGIIITAGYFLYMVQRVLLGPLNPVWFNIGDINKREIFTLVPLMIVIIAIGVYPLIILNYQSPAIANLIRHIGGALF